MSDARYCIYSIFYILYDVLHPERELIAEASSRAQLKRDFSSSCLHQRQEAGAEPETTVRAVSH